MPMLCLGLILPLPQKESQEERTQKALNKVRSGKTGPLPGSEPSDLAYAAGNGSYKPTSIKPGA